MISYLGEKDYQHGSIERTGILLTNLGTPDSPTAKALKPYLKEFLSDPRVIEIPKFIWQIILRLIILNIRPRRSAKNYKKIWTEEGSPLLSISLKQLTKVEKHLKNGVRQWDALQRTEVLAVIVNMPFYALIRVIAFQVALWIPELVPTNL